MAVKTHIEREVKNPGSWMIMFILHGAQPVTFIADTRTEVNNVIAEWKKALQECPGTFNDLRFYQFTSIDSPHAFILAQIVSVIAEPLKEEYDEMDKLHMEAKRAMMEAAIEEAREKKRYRPEEGDE